MKNNQLQNRFNEIVNSVGRTRNKVHIIGKEDQENFSYLINEITKYGFDFCPEFYVEHLIDELETLVNDHK